MPMEDNLGFVQIDRGATIRTGEENLTFIRMQLAAALAALNLDNRRGSIHKVIIADYNCRILKINMGKKTVITQLYTSLRPYLWNKLLSHVTLFSIV